MVAADVGMRMRNVNFLHMRDNSLVAAFLESESVRPIKDAEGCDPKNIQQ